MNAIPKDKVKEIIQKSGKMEIAGIASALIQSGYKHPEEPPHAEGERLSPFTRDLEVCLKELCDEGTLKCENVGGKNQYEINPAK